MPLLFGKPVAEKILSETKGKMTMSGIVPGLGVVLVGDDPASRVYVGLKEARAGELGFRFVKMELPFLSTEAEVLDAIRKLNEDEGIHGIIVQLPLPSGMNADRIIAAIDPAKDADGFLATSVRTPVFPEAMIELAKSSGASLSGKSGVAFVNSERFGKTMINALRNEGMTAEYLLLSSRVRSADAAIQEEEKETPSGLSARNASHIDADGPHSDEASEFAMTEKERIREADFVFTALGRPGVLSRNMFKKDSVVIDGGISKRDGKIVGDVSTDGSDADIFLSPVPGGVGPVTVACLLRRVSVLALENRKTAA